MRPREKASRALLNGLSLIKPSCKRPLRLDIQMEQLARIAAWPGARREMRAEAERMRIRRRTTRTRVVVAAAMAVQADSGATRGTPISAPVAKVVRCSPLPLIASTWAVVAAPERGIIPIATIRL